MRIFSGIKYYLTPQWEKLFTMKVIKMLPKTIKKVQMTLKISKIVDISLLSLSLERFQCYFSDKIREYDPK